MPAHLPFCPHCGARNEPDSRFCESCGQALEDASAVARSAPTVAPDLPAAARAAGPALRSWLAGIPRPFLGVAAVVVVVGVVALASLVFVVLRGRSFGSGDGGTTILDPELEMATPTPPGGGIAVTIDERLVAVTPTAAELLVGCYRDSSPFDLDGYLKRGTQNTPQRCIASCRERGFAYAGVQYGESCLCGNSYGRYGPADNCNYPCSGDAASICGGYNANSVYRTGG